jgi:acyl CoA:acetate/3-ketoacid CoA transferase alpha subunit
MSKQISLKEAVKLVDEGAVMYLGGLGLSRTPMAFVREMVRQKKGGLHLVASGNNFAVDMLAAANLIEKIESDGCGVGFEEMVSNVNRRVMEKSLKVEDYSGLSLNMRLYGGSIGVPFMPTKSLLGSDLEFKPGFKGEGKSKAVDCPFTGEIVSLVPSINADIGVIVAQRVGEDGTVQIDDSLGMDLDGLRASEIKIVIAEEIVSEDKIRKEAQKNVLPGIFVDFVVQLSHGAYPTALFGYYDYDEENLRDYLKWSTTESGFEKYRKKWIKKSEADLIGRMSPKKKSELKADIKLGY